MAKEFSNFQVGRTMQLQTGNGNFIMTRRKVQKHIQ